MMAQHVGQSRMPASFLFVLAVFHLTNANVLAQVSTFGPRISSIRIAKNEELLKELDIDSLAPVVRIIGENLDKELGLRWSPDVDQCHHNYPLSTVWINPNGHEAFMSFASAPSVDINPVYFCIRNVTGDGEHWTFLGRSLIVDSFSLDGITRRRRSNDFGPAIGEGNNSSAAVPATDEIRIEGLRVEYTDKEPRISEYGVPEVLVGYNTTVRLFGIGITQKTLIAFTDVPAKYGTICEKIKTQEFSVFEVESNSALVTINLAKGTYFLCAKQSGSDNSTDVVLFKHQGDASWKSIGTYEKLLPLWLSIVFMCLCICCSALFSGLNLGLMALDRTELKILRNIGTPKEKEYAKKIQPVRDHGNYLLCTILFSIVLANSIFTVILDDLTSGLIAVVSSTLSIVVFGEIWPQAICSRHGLMISAKTIFITKFTMLITFPLSYPISKILDFILGEEIGNVYNRERLKELVNITTEYNDLEKDEVNIISGALELRKKTVADVMTRIEDVYMLDYNAILDFETVSEIMKSGFSRVPVYQGSRTNIVTMLYIKDLAFVDPDDNTPLKTLCQFYQNPCNFVFEDVTLDVMFKQFKEGHKGHMAFVQRVNNEGDGDPFYEVVGLVTLEDVIEELIQAEIMDETDVFTDNRSKRRRPAHSTKLLDFTSFAEKKDNQRIRISPQLTLAMFQYLSTTVEAFKPDTISETILRRLLKQDIIYHIKVKTREKAKSDPTTVIYQQGKPVDYFVLILEGRVEVTVGTEGMMFESGPFTYFGSQALTANIGIVTESPANTNPQTMGSIQSLNLDAMLRHTFVPDYTVRAVTEVFYLKVKRSLYLAAKRATLLERSQKDPKPSHDQFDDEVEKLLHSLDEEDQRSAPDSPVLPRDKDKDSKNMLQRNVTAPTSPVPVSASPMTNAKFVSSSGDHNGKLKSSPAKMLDGSTPKGGQSKLDLDAEILSRQNEAAVLPPRKKSLDDEEKVHLLPKKDDS
ncbi:metal transporter CNNM4 [Cephus cinctus]|uniref:Metal transporter CNNM4 n=1 Tax=Cephus cinctus TaxID=211228 RepID=A0AAJ7CH76_CEPCN|nr:metal transporter CNNM4 [Cephus cinctus]